MSVDTKTSNVDESPQIQEESETGTSPTRNVRTLFTFRDVANAVIAKKPRVKRSKSSDKNQAVDDGERQTSPTGNIRTLFTFQDVAFAVIEKQSKSRGNSTGSDVDAQDVVAMAADEEILITDVAEYLQLGVAYLSGGRTSEGFPIVTLPDCSKFTNIKDEDFVRVMTYLVRIPSYYEGLKNASLLEYDKGFIILVDRRTESWSGVKSTLMRIAQGYFPGIIQCVYVLKPKGFLQKTLSDVRFKFIKDDFKFQIVLLDSVRELHGVLDPGQLTEEFEGSLAFSLKAWIEDRMAIERFASNCKERSSAVQTLSDELTQTPLSNDEDGALEMLLEHRKRHMEVGEDLTSAMKYGQTLLSCMRRPLQEFPDQNPDKIATTCAIERLLVQLEETEKNFETLWEEHELKLSQCLDLRRFENEFTQVLIILDNIHDKINSAMELGDSVSRVQYLIRIHEDLQNDGQAALDRADKFGEQGNNLIDQNHYAVDCIKPKCSEVSTKTREISEKIKKRAMVLERSLDLQQRIEKAQNWCSKGMKLLAEQEMDRCQSKDGALQYLTDIKDCLDGVNDIKLNNPKEFRIMFDNILTTEAKDYDPEAGITEVIGKMEDVKTMFEKRKESLDKVVAKFERPVQAVPATPVTPPSPDMPNGTPKPRKNRKSKGQTSFPTHEFYVPMPTQTDRTIEIVREDADAGNLGNNNEILRGEDTNSLSYKRRHVMNELLETEKMYVSELEAVLRGYIEEMENPDLMSFIPDALHGKKDVLFANWQELYNFHKSTFLVDIQNYKNTPTLIGKCFVKRKEELDRLYSTYCQNKPRSELLRRDCGNNNPFFQECQRSLGHKLPLSAYLLKPVQRITKYQLLLKEMLKYSALEKGSEDLEAALDCMLTVLKYVNDSMHQVAITGFQAEQGKLLMQGALYVWVETKRHGIRDIRQQKKTQRHVFLYEKLVLFCKKRGDIKEKTCYAFKSSLKTSEIGLTEYVKGDKKKFELWLGGREAVYTFLAPNENEKMTWVKAVRQALLQVSMGSIEVETTHRKGSSIFYSSLPESTSLPESPYSPTPNGSALRSPTPSEQSQRTPSEPMDDDNDDVSWGSGEFSDGESEDEILEESRKEVQSVQPVTMSNQQYLVLAEYNLVEDGELSIREGELVQLEKSISFESMHISPPSPTYHVRPPIVSAKPHFTRTNSFFPKRIRRRSGGTTKNNKKNKWLVEECRS
ncbi:guanine nucleotide exchange factor DBS-like [Amphiura filiformis]|uniref:guanine nucleotide exchange factor DBS-like n=1 Tax=Amphiura filiformis TaxID=82378 RepID=UPI003B224212